MGGRTLVSVRIDAQVEEVLLGYMRTHAVTISEALRAVIDAGCAVVGDTEVARG